MKEELSAVDLHFLVKELAVLVDAKIDKIHMPLPSELLFIFHKTGHGKFFLRVLPGKMLYLTTVKFKNPPEPHGYCAYLRKQLDQARLVGIIQKGSERIVELCFETKEGVRNVIIELFSKGNVIVADEHEIILSPLEQQEWKERSIRKGEPYRYPVRKYSFHTATAQDIEALLRETTQDAVVKALAADLGVGGTYAEEICLLSQVRKTIKPWDLKPDDIIHLVEGIDALRSQTLAPRIVFKLGQPLAVIPFPLKVYEDLDTVPLETFNHGLDEIYTKHLLAKTNEKQHAAANQDLLKTQKIVEAQELQVNSLRHAVEENQQKGELLYHNYSLVKSILDVINSLRKNKSWDEVKKQYAGHDVVRSIDEKTGTVVLELGFG